MIQEQSPIVSMKLGGVPPPQRGELWQKLIDEILNMPDDGVWLQVRLLTADDAKRCQGAVQRWVARNSDQIDCAVEMRRGPANVLWVRKNLARNPIRRGASGG